MLCSVVDRPSARTVCPGHRRRGRMPARCCRSQTPAFRCANRNRKRVLMAFASRIALASLLVLLPTTSLPSEGLRFMAAYLCDPVPTTDAVLDRCMSLKPDLQVSYASTKRDWHRRNDVPAAELKKRCNAYAAGLGATDQARFKQYVRELNSETIAQKIALINANPDSCQGLLGEIASGKADLQTFVDSNQ